MPAAAAALPVTAVTAGFGPTPATAATASALLLLPPSARAGRSA